MSIKRIAVATAAAVIALLSAAGPAAADEPQPEGPMNRTVEVQPGWYNAVVQRSCGATEVWGVAAGRGTPEFNKGNYQVCHYGTSSVSILIPEEYNYTDDDHLIDAAVRQKANGEAASRAFASYCPHWLPAGPNRAPIVNYKAQAYQITVWDTYANGDVQLRAFGIANFYSSAAVTWSPTCNTR
ncbi:hypothetical protein [Dactylosporangium darangshiense]|uniref:Secreted protein n=1 Tax=Dactylosporangium darangshiense TaxID=579108 RepID=A0ABP8DII9_9ACTN